MPDYKVDIVNGSLAMSMEGDDVSSDDGLRTAVILSLYINRRADEGDELPSDLSDRKGFWGDEFLATFSDRLGSKLWQLDRSKLTPDLQPVGEKFVAESLQWLVDDGVAAAVDVTSELVAEGMYYLISIDRPGEDPVNFRFSHVWDAEEAKWDGYDIDEVAITPTGPALLSELDFTVPSVQTFPETAAGLASALGQPTALASHIFPLQETATNYADTVGSGSLVVASAAQGQTCPAWDGTSYTGRKAFEVTAGSSIASNSGDTSLFDQTTGSFAVLLALRCNSTSDGPIIGKRNATSGWAIGPTGSAGVNIRFDDTVIKPVFSEVTSTVKDGSLQAFIVVVNRTNNTVYIYTERGVTTGDISALGSLATSSPLALGLQSGYAVGASVSQSTYLALLEGAAAEVLDQAAFDSWWQHAKNSDLTTVSRNCPLTVKVADGYYAHFAPNTVPTAYNENFTDSSKRGLRCNSAKVNEIPYSEISTGANNVGVAPTDFAASAPDGFKSATTLLSTAPAGYQEKVCTTLASTQYTGSMLIKEVTVGVQGRVVAYDLSNGAEIGATAYTATDTAQEVEYVFTTPIGCISVGLRCELTSNAETVIAWGWCLNKGDGRVYARTNGSPIALVGSDYRKAGIVTGAAFAALGEVNATFVRNNYTGDSYVWRIYNGANNQNRRHSNVDTAARIRSWTYSGDAVLEDVVFQNIFSSHTEFKTTSVWDESATGVKTGGKESYFEINGVRYDGAASPWENATASGVVPTSIDIGHAGGLTQLDGDIQSITIYDGPTT